MGKGWAFKDSVENVGFYMDFKRQIYIYIYLEANIFSDIN